MKYALYILGALAAAGAIAYLRVFPFTEKKTKEPERTAHAQLIERRVQPGNPHRSGRTMMGYSFILIFRLDDGTPLELYAYETEFGGLREGMTGMLTWKGRYFVGLEREDG